MMHIRREHRPIQDICPRTILYFMLNSLTSYHCNCIERILHTSESELILLENLASCHQKGYIYTLSQVNVYLLKIVIWISELANCMPAERFWVIWDHWTSSLRDSLWSYLLYLIQMSLMLKNVVKITFLSIRLVFITWNFYFFRAVHFWWIKDCPK